MLSTTNLLFSIFSFFRDWHEFTIRPTRLGIAVRLGRAEVQYSRFHSTSASNRNSVNARLPSRQALVGTCTTCATRSRSTSVFQNKINKGLIIIPLEQKVQSTIDSDKPQRRCECPTPYKRMKRPREDKHAMIGQENNIFQQSSSLKSRTAVTETGTASTPSPFPREWSSCHRRSRRSSPVLPKFLLAGCCFIAALLFVTNSASFPSLPVADASRATTGFDADHYFLRDQKDDFTFLRRLKRKKDKVSSDDDEEEEPLQQSSSSSNAEECTVPAGVCTRCTFTEQKTYEACHETGRWQRFKCVFPGDSGTSEDEDDLRYEMMSCKHTPFDEGIAMVRTLLDGFLQLETEKQPVIVGRNWSLHVLLPFFDFSAMQKHSLIHSCFYLSCS